jgi:hypothetical protein
MALPNEIIKELTTLAEKGQVPYAEVEKEFLETLNGGFVQNDSDLKTDTEKLEYALLYCKSRFLSRPPVQDYDVIPVGFSGVRTTKKGTTMAEIFVLVPFNNNIELRRIVLRDSTCDLINNLTLFLKYHVKLGMFTGGKDFIADSRTKFDESEMVDKEKLMQKVSTLAKSIKMADAKKYPSLKDSSGYTNQLDWRKVRGLVLRHKRGKRKDESEYGFYAVLDDSISAERVVTNDGQVQSPGFTVWVPPQMVIYDDDSLIDAYGTITLDQQGNASMNAVLIVPIHVKHIMDE